MNVGLVMAICLGVFAAVALIPWLSRRLDAWEARRRRRRYQRMGDIHRQRVAEYRRLKSRTGGNS